MLVAWAGAWWLKGIVQVRLGAGVSKSFVEYGDVRDASRGDPSLEQEKTEPFQERLFELEADELESPEECETSNHCSFGRARYRRPVSYVPCLYSIFIPRASLVMACLSHCLRRRRLDSFSYLLKLSFYVCIELSNDLDGLHNAKLCFAFF